MGSYLYISYYSSFPYIILGDLGSICVQLILVMVFSFYLDRVYRRDCIWIHPDRLYSRICKIGQNSCANSSFLDFLNNQCKYSLMCCCQVSSLIRTSVGMDLF